jgi:ribosomal protein L37E
MSLIAKLIMLRRDLKAKKPNRCERCGLYYNEDQKECPHCKGLPDEEVASLQDREQKTVFGNIRHLVLVFVGLAILLGILSMLI